MMNLFIAMQINLHIDQYGQSDQVARLKLSAALPELLEELSDTKIAALGCRVVSSARRISWMPYEQSRVMGWLDGEGLPPGESLIPSSAERWGLYDANPEVAATAAKLLHDAILDAAVEAFRRRVLRLITISQARAYIREGYGTFRDTWANDYEPNDVYVFRGEHRVQEIVDRIAHELFPDRIDL